MHRMKIAVLLKVLFAIFYVKGVDAACQPNPCASGGTCETVFNPTEEFLCHCPRGSSGRRCELETGSGSVGFIPLATEECPINHCFNGGTCGVAPNGYYCLCPAGFTGSRCSVDVDECASNPCAPGATCVDRPFGYRCFCTNGWMGPRCDRPCRDVYGSCDHWKDMKLCDKSKTKTTFFDQNCAVSCGVCTFARNITDSDVPPLPPFLNSLEFLIGKWENNFSQPWRYPTDFPAETAIYRETLDIKPMHTLEFGNPGLSFRSVSVSVENPEDERVTVGHLTLKKNTAPPVAALLCSSNEGLNTIEKGLVLENVLYLNITYMQSHPALNSQLLPLGGTRTIRRSAPDALEMVVLKLNQQSNPEHFRKTFFKVHTYTI